MLISPQSITRLSSQFFDLVTNSYDNDTTLTVSTAIYNNGAYKAGLPPVGTFSWTFVPVGGQQLLQGLFICDLPASAIGPGPNAPNCVFPLTLVTIGLASDLVTERFTDVIQGFPKANNT